MPSDSLSRIKDEEHNLASGRLFIPDDESGMTAMLAHCQLGGIRRRRVKLTCRTRGNLEDNLVDSPRPFPSVVRIMILNADSPGLARARSWSWLVSHWQADPTRGLYHSRNTP